MSSKNRKRQAAAAPVEAPRRGRPAGKRSDPDIVQVTAYIPRRLHLAVKRALLDEGAKRGERREFSTLIEERLVLWLRGPGAPLAPRRKPKG